MSQFGMQLPGGGGRRGASLNVYTGLMTAAVAALIAACVFTFMAASKLGKNGDAFSPQVAKQIDLK